MKENVIGNVKKYINQIINSELLIIFIGLFLFIKMFFFYEQTIYIADVINIDILAKTFIFSMFIVTALFIFPNRARFILGTIVNLLLSILMFADNLYYNYSTSLISVSQISNVKYVEQISATVGDLINFGQIIYFIDIIIVLVLLISKVIKIEKKKKYNFKIIAIYVSIMAIVYGSTIPTYISEAEAVRYNKKIQLEKGTLYAFHFLDLKTNINLKESAKYKTRQQAEEAYSNLKDSYNEKYEEDTYNLNGVAKGKDVILLQLESYQQFLVNKSINGKEITPNLNKFLDENIKINNMMSQSYSTTADSEHSTMNSLYPLENGMAFAQYSSNSYDDLFKMYNNADYYTVYMHGNSGSFWNRKNIYRLLNVDEVDFIESFDENSERINEWLSDEALYTQAVDKLANVKQENNKPFFASIVSASCHTAFDLPGLNNKYDKVSIDVGKYKNTYFGNYLEAANYADYAFGIFIDKLKEKGLYDDTVIFVFGDHYAMQMYNLEMLEYLKDNDYELNKVDIEINYINVACGMRIPGVEHTEITKPVGKLDIKPTLTYLSGIEDGFSLGENMLGTKDFICLDNGIIVADKYYYNGKWYNRENGEKVDETTIDDEQKKLFKFYISSMDEELTISKSIILNNLLKK